MVLLIRFKNLQSFVSRIESQPARTALGSGTGGVRTQVNPRGNGAIRIDPADAIAPERGHVGERAGRIEHDAGCLSQGGSLRRRVRQCRIIDSGI